MQLYVSRGGEGFVQLKVWRDWVSEWVSEWASVCAHTHTHMHMREIIACKYTYAAAKYSLMT